MKPMWCVCIGSGTVEYGYLRHWLFASDGFLGIKISWTDSTLANLRFYWYLHQTDFCIKFAVTKVRQMSVFHCTKKTFAYAHTCLCISPPCAAFISVISSTLLVSWLLYNVRYPWKTTLISEVIRALCVRICTMPYIILVYQQNFFYIKERVYAVLAAKLFQKNVKPPPSLEEHISRAIFDAIPLRDNARKRPKMKEEGK